MHLLEAILSSEFGVLVGIDGSRTNRSYYYKYYGNVLVVYVS